MTQAAAAAFLMLVLLFGGPWVTVQSTGAPEPQPARTAQEQTDAPGADESSVLRVWNGTETVEMTMAAYLPGVVRGEMPATFEEEALKAQAVAERTYIYYHLQRGGKANHPDADVCMDHTCCNAWTGAEQAAQKWGEQAEAYEAKIQEAVRATDGQVMLYNGQLILAAFHSSSGGRTADRGEVWGKSLPYLASVESPESIDAVPNYIVEKKVPAEEFKKAVLERYPAAQFSDDMSAWVTISSISPSGRVEDAALGGVPVKGYNVRSLFDLRSTMFTVSADNEGIIFTTAGYGHGVGLSQYGANIMAREGSGYGEILAAYYTGTGLTRVIMD